MALESAQGGWALAGSADVIAGLSGGLAASTGVGAAVLGIVAGSVAAYKASDYWTSNTASGQWVVNGLGAATYGIGKLFGNYNFIVPFYSETTSSIHARHKGRLHHVTKQRPSRKK